MLVMSYMKDSTSSEKLRKNSTKEAGKTEWQKLTSADYLKRDKFERKSN